MNPFAWARAEVLHAAWKHGRYLPPDRLLLERTILPGLAAEAEVERVLSVGIAWYTQKYADIFTRQSFATIDMDPTREGLGGKTKHVVGDLCELERHFAASEAFDVILMNGVIGFGLNAPNDVDRALRACAARMRPGGTLLLGINEEKPTYVDPTSVAAHSLFAPRPFGEWPNGRVTVAVPFRERSHTFAFWRRL